MICPSLSASVKSSTISTGFAHMRNSITTKMMYTHPLKTTYHTHNRLHTFLPKRFSRRSHFSSRNFCPFRCFGISQCFECQYQIPYFHHMSEYSRLALALRKDPVCFFTHGLDEMRQELTTLKQNQEKLMTNVASITSVSEWEHTFAPKAMESSQGLTQSQPT